MVTVSWIEIVFVGGESVRVQEYQDCASQEEAAGLIKMLQARGIKDIRSN